MKHIAVFVAQHDFRDPELKEPLKIFREEGHNINILSSRVGECVGIEGSKIHADTSLDSFNIHNVDGLVLVGGIGMKEYLNNSLLLHYIKQAFDEGKVVAAICIATGALANAGILQGKKATGWEGVKEAIIKGGAEYTGEPVTVDGKIVTGSGPEAAEDFGKAVSNTLYN